jgi:hypothetical protein
MRANIFVVAAAGLAATAFANAAVIWDESVNGDLPNTHASARDIGVLPAGSSEIIGHVDTNLLVDPVDFIRFTTLSPLTIDLTSLALGPQATGFGGILYFDDGNDVADQVTVRVVPVDNIFGQLEPGTYVFRASTFGTIGSLDYGVRFNVARPSPEALLENLVSAVIGMNIGSGIGNALDSKLQNALAALDRAQAGDTASASGILYSFIQSVEAQRGKKLTQAQADELVNEAKAVIAALESL